MEKATKVFWEIHIPWTAPSGEACSETVNLSAETREAAIKDALDNWHDEMDERWLRCSEVHPRPADCVLGAIAVRQLVEDPLE